MSFWCDFGAGWFGGVVGLVVGHPFDTLKVSFEPFGKLAAPKFQCVNDTTSWNALAGYFIGCVGIRAPFYEPIFQFNRGKPFQFSESVPPGTPFHQTEPNRKLCTVCKNQFKPMGSV